MFENIKIPLPLDFPAGFTIHAPISPVNEYCGKYFFRLFKIYFEYFLNAYYLFNCL